MAAKLTPEDLFYNCRWLCALVEVFEGTCCLHLLDDAFDPEKFSDTPGLIQTLQEQTDGAANAALDLDGVHAKVSHSDFRSSIKKFTKSDN